MSKKGRNTRNILPNKGYYLIIDTGNDMDSQLISTIVDIVLDNLAIACSSRGIARIPYFGLASINLQFNIVWKLSRLKGNYSKIIKQFSSLKNIAISGRLSEEEYFDFLHMGLKLIINDINELDKNANKYEELSDSKPKFKIVLFTMKDGFLIKYYLSTLLEQLDTNKILEIQIVEISKKVSYNSVRDGILRLLQINGKVDLEKLVKGWLVDIESDCEDLVIKVGDDKLKCDIHEILLDTNLIPFSNCFHIHKEITNSSSSYLPDPVMPVYRLEVVERISSSGISESCVFGYPVQLRPTQSILNSSTLESNAQRFATLCKILFDADEYLIAKLMSEDTPQSCFVLMPGDCTFLVKSVATKELVLPNGPAFSNLDIPSSVDADYELRQQMYNLVFNLPLKDEYSPLNITSNICSSLRKQLLSSCSKGAKDCSGNSSGLNSTTPFPTVPKLKRKSLGEEKISNNKKQNKANSLKLIDHLSGLN